jgi:hypothetical protein
MLEAERPDGVIVCAGPRPHAALAPIIFLGAIREDRSTRSDILESAKSMALHEAIRDSAATGRVVAPVAIPE